MTCLRNVRVSSAVALTNQYNFSPRGCSYVTAMSPATTDLNWTLHIKRSVFLPYLTKFRISRKASIKGPPSVNPVAVNISVYLNISNLTKIRRVGATLILADRQMDMTEVLLATM